ncbi:MAG: hypothetical protein QM737_02040 [Ferruginibacter sp.]
MRISKAFFLLVFCLLASQLMNAQNKPAGKPAKKSDVVKVPKFKAPKLQTLLDKYKDSVSVSADEAVRIIGMPLKISDDKKTEYSISSYQFLYRKKGITEDEEGKTQPTSTISADRFKVTPLPQLWVNLIIEQVKAGEEFYFFDVIAKDAQGRVMYAPNLKITIR